MALCSKRNESTKNDCKKRIQMMPGEVEVPSGDIFTKNQYFKVLKGKDALVAVYCILLISPSFCGIFSLERLEAFYACPFGGAIELLRGIM